MVESKRQENSNGELINVDKHMIKVVKIDDNKDIGDYILKNLSELGRIFNKSIESSNWSVKVKDDIKQKFYDIEKV